MLNYCQHGWSNKDFLAGLWTGPKRSECVHSWSALTLKRKVVRRRIRIQGSDSSKRTARWIVYRSESIKPFARQVQIFKLASSNRLCSESRLESELGMISYFLDVTPLLSSRSRCSQAQHLVQCINKISHAYEYDTFERFSPVPKANFNVSRLDRFCIHKYTYKMCFFEYFVYML